MTSHPRILFLIHHPVEDASSRYRIFQFIPALEAEGFTCHVRPFTTRALFTSIRRGGNLPVKLTHTLYAILRRATQLLRLSAYDLVFIHREAFPFFTPMVEEFVLNHHPKVIFGFDDAVHIGHTRKPAKHSILYRYKYGLGITRVMERVSAIVAGSPVLERAAHQYNDNVSMIPTVVDLDRYPFKLPSSVTDRPITIGWYGSDSTSPYLKDILPALQRLAEKYPAKVRFRFFGDTRLSLPLPDFEAPPFRLETEIDDLQTMDIGLMPLPDTEWTRAKCAFKAIQYMALGIPTIVTPIGMSGDLIQDSENGLHATTSEEWFNALDRLMQDLSLRQRLSIGGRKTIEDGYSLKRWTPNLVRVLRTVLKEDPGYSEHSNREKIDSCA